MPPCVKTAMDGVVCIGTELRLGFAVYLKLPRGC